MGQYYIFQDPSAMCVIAKETAKSEISVSSIDSYVTLRIKLFDVVSSSGGSQSIRGKI